MVGKRLVERLAARRATCRAGRRASARTARSRDRLQPGARRRGPFEVSEPHDEERGARGDVGHPAPGPHDHAGQLLVLERVARMRRLRSADTTWRSRVSSARRAALPGSEARKIAMTALPVPALRPAPATVHQNAKPVARKLRCSSSVERGCGGRGVVERRDVPDAERRRSARRCAAAVHTTTRHAPERRGSTTAVARSTRPASGCRRGVQQHGREHRRRPAGAGRSRGAGRAGSCAPRGRSSPSRRAAVRARRPSTVANPAAPAIARRGATGCRLRRGSRDADRVERAENGDRRELAEVSHGGSRRSRSCLRAGSARGSTPRRATRARRGTG